MKYSRDGEVCRVDRNMVTVSVTNIQLLPRRGEEVTLQWESNLYHACDAAIRDGTFVRKVDSQWQIFDSYTNEILFKTGGSSAPMTFCLYCGEFLEQKNE